MIKFLNDETVAGYRHGAGSVATFDAVTEAALIAQGDAIIYPLPILIAQSYAPITRSSKNGAGGETPDTTFITLASNTVPGGTMNFNGLIAVEQDWKYTDSATTKVLAMDWGGNNVSWGQIASAGIVRSCYRIAIKNTNSLSAQNVFNNTSYGNAALDAATAVNTANNVTIDHKCKWGANVASEQIILLGYSVWYYPGTT